MTAFLPPKRSALVVAVPLCLAVLLLRTSNAGADTTYNIVNYKQDGVTMGGTITTDTNSGTVSAGDITDFSIVITPAAEPAFTLTPANTYVTPIFCNGLSASPTSLYLTPYFNSGTSYFTLWGPTGQSTYLDYRILGFPPTRTSTTTSFSFTTSKATSCSNSWPGRA